MYSQRTRAAEQRLFDAQMRVMTGRKWERLTENPIDGHYVLNAQAMKSRIHQIEANLRTASDLLGFQENAVGELASLTQQAYVLALRGANDGSEQSSRDAMAKEIEGLQQRLIEVGNTRGANGEFVFAGQANDSKPLVVAAGELQFVGDTLPRLIEIRPGDLTRMNIRNADTLFLELHADLETLKNNLLSGNKVALSEVSVADMQRQLDRLSGVRAELGQSIQTVDRLKDEYSRRTFDLTKRISDRQDVDLAEALTEYQAAATVYQASLQIASQGMRLSLLEFLR